MGRHTSANDARQGSLFEAAPAPVSRDGGLGGLATQLSHRLSEAVRECGLSRFSVAAEMGRLLGDEVSKSMLDAYTAESRETHQINVVRFVAFVIATKNFALLDFIARQCGCRVLVGEDAQLAEIGLLRQQRTEIDGRLRELERSKPSRKVRS